MQAKCNKFEKIQVSKVLFDMSQKHRNEKAFESDLKKFSRIFR